MSMDINFNFNTNYTSESKQEVEETKKIEDVEVYSTYKVEEERTSFGDTFEKQEQKDNKQAQEFIEGLIQYKSATCETLNIPEEKYDALACMALAFASQETGMGEEEGYKGENQGFGKAFRGFVKFFTVNILNDGSASSGMTQIKIFDFLNPKKGKLTEDEISFLKDMGVKATGISSNNLFERPDLSALSTIVVLNNLSNNYDRYSNQVDIEHERLSKMLQEEYNMTEEECLSKGEEIIQNLTGLYDTLPNNDEKEALRNSIKGWFEAANGEKDEELKLLCLNIKIHELGSDFTLEQSDLDFIRFALSTPENKFTRQEIIPYFYKYGTGDYAFKLDRYLTDKFGDYFKNPEIYDYDQYVQNVSSLTSHYADQFGYDEAFIENSLALK